MTLLNDIFLGLEVALLVVFAVVVATSLLADRHEARRLSRPAQHRRGGPHPA